jgi:hypothetical protein
MLDTTTAVACCVPVNTSDPALPTAKVADRYRETANSIRALIPLMQYAAVRDQLSVLAIEYDKLAECIETVSETLQIPTAQLGQRFIVTAADDPGRTSSARALPVGTSSA